MAHEICVPSPREVRGVESAPNTELLLRTLVGRLQKEFVKLLLAIGSISAQVREIRSKAFIYRHRMMRAGIHAAIEGSYPLRSQSILELTQRVPARVAKDEIERFESIAGNVSPRYPGGLAR